MSSCHRKWKQVFSSGILLPLFLFFIAPPAAARPLAQIQPASLNLLTLSPEQFQPANLLGIKVFPDRPLYFEFMVDPGDTRFQGEDLEGEASRLVKYFLASLTVPGDDLWVNLAPGESERVIPSAFGLTQMGRDLLSQDFLLKQLTASLMYPESETGREFWEKVYTRLNESFAGEDVPVDAFNRIWIAPGSATVYVDSRTAVVTESRLNVMLEEDYRNARALAAGEDRGAADSEPGADEDVTTRIMREVIVPAVEEEVNSGKHFAPLRQIYNALVLATWFKRNLRESLLGQVYVERDKVGGVESGDPEARERIYNQYLEAFREGAYDLIREEYDPETQQIIPRKYFSGGALLNDAAMSRVYEEHRDLAMLGGLDRDNVFLAGVGLDRSEVATRDDSAMVSRLQEVDSDQIVYVGAGQGRQARLSIMGVDYKLIGGDLDNDVFQNPSDQSFVIRIVQDLSFYGDAETVAEKIDIVNRLADQGLTSRIYTSKRLQSGHLALEVDFLDGPDMNTLDNLSDAQINGVTQLVNELMRFGIEMNDFFKTSNFKLIRRGNTEKVVIVDFDRLRKFEPNEWDRVFNNYINAFNWSAWKRLDSENKIEQALRNGKDDLRKMFEGEFDRAALTVRHDQNPDPATLALSYLPLIPQWINDAGRMPSLLRVLREPGMGLTGDDRAAARRYDFLKDYERLIPEDVRGNDRVLAERLRFDTTWANTFRQAFRRVNRRVEDVRSMLSVGSGRWYDLYPASKVFSDLELAHGVDNDAEEGGIVGSNMEGRRIREFWEEGQREIQVSDFFIDADRFLREGSAAERYDLVTLAHPAAHPWIRGFLATESDWRPIQNLLSSVQSRLSDKGVVLLVLDHNNWVNKERGQEFLELLGGDYFDTKGTLEASNGFKWLSENRNNTSPRPLDSPDRVYAFDKDGLAEVNRRIQERMDSDRAILTILDSGVGQNTNRKNPYDLTNFVYESDPLGEPSLRLSNGTQFPVLGGRAYNHIFDVGNGKVVRLLHTHIFSQETFDQAIQRLSRIARIFSANNLIPRVEQIGFVEGSNGRSFPAFLMDKVEMVPLSRIVSHDKSMADAVGRLFGKLLDLNFFIDDFFPSNIALQRSSSGFHAYVDFDMALEEPNHAELLARYRRVIETNFNSGVVKTKLLAQLDERRQRDFATLSEQRERARELAQQVREISLKNRRVFIEPLGQGLLAQTGVRPDSGYLGHVTSFQAIWRMLFTDTNKYLIPAEGTDDPRSQTLFFYEGREGDLTITSQKSQYFPVSGVVSLIFDRRSLESENVSFRPTVDGFEEVQTGDLVSLEHLLPVSKRHVWETFLSVAEAKDITLNESQRNAAARSLGFSDAPTLEQELFFSSTALSPIDQMSKAAQSPFLTSGELNRIWGMENADSSKKLIEVLNASQTKIRVVLGDEVEVNALNGFLDRLPVPDDKLLIVAADHIYENLKERYPDNTFLEDYFSGSMDQIVIRLATDKEIFVREEFEGEYGLLLPVFPFKLTAPEKVSEHVLDGLRAELGIEERRLIVLGSPSASDMRNFMEIYNHQFLNMDISARPLVVIAPASPVSANEYPFFQNNEVITRDQKRSSLPDTTGHNVLILNTRGELPLFYGLSAKDGFSVVGTDRNILESVSQGADTWVMGRQHLWVNNKEMYYELIQRGAITPFDGEAFEASQDVSQKQSRIQQGQSVVSSISTIGQDIVDNVAYALANRILDNDQRLAAGDPATLDPLSETINPVDYKKVSMVSSFSSAPPMLLYEGKDLPYLGGGEMNRIFDLGDGTVLRVLVGGGSGLHQRLASASFMELLNEMSQSGIVPDFIEKGEVKDQFGTVYHAFRFRKVDGNSLDKLIEKNGHMDDAHIEPISRLLTQLIINKIYIFDFRPENILMQQNSDGMWHAFVDHDRAEKWDSFSAKDLIEQYQREVLYTNEWANANYDAVYASALRMLQEKSNELSVPDNRDVTTKDPAKPRGDSATAPDVLEQKGVRVEAEANWQDVKTMLESGTAHMIPEFERNYAGRRWVRARVPVSALYQDNPLLNRVNPQFPKIQGYADQLRSGSEAPPVMIVVENGQLRLVDGNHRVVARNIVNGQYAMIEGFLAFEDPASLTTEKDVGGIDLNPEMLEIREDRRGADFELPVDPGLFNNENFTGFTPVILQMRPVSLPMYLGLLEPRPPELDPLARR